MTLRPVWATLYPVTNNIFLLYNNIYYNITYYNNKYVIVYCYNNTVILGLAISIFPSNNPSSLPPFAFP